MSKIFQNFLSNRVLSRSSIFLIDLLMIIFSCITIYVMRYGFTGLTAGVRADGITLTLLLLLFNSIFFVSFRTFSGILRFSSFTDLIRIVYSLGLGYFLTFIAVYVIKRVSPEFSVSKVTFVAVFSLNMFLMIFSRILVKETYDHITGRAVKPINVFIYGTKQAGISVAKALKGNLEVNYRVLGFISDEQHMVGKQLIGVTIHANDENLFRTLESKDVKTIIVSPQKMEEIKNSNLLVNFVDHNISLLTTVPIEEWSGMIMSRSQIKDVQIEDLLPREPIDINMFQIAENLEGKRVMVTGAAGSIGSEIVRQVATFNPYRIILIDQAETPLHNMRLELQEKWRDLRTDIIVADISNPSRMEKIFARTRPQYISRSCL